MELGALYNLDGATANFPGPLQQGTCVATVGPNMFDPFASRLTKEGGQQLLTTIPVLNVGGQDHRHEDQTHRIDQDMALAAIYLFPGIVAPLVAGLGALDALTVDDRPTGVAIAPFQLARLLPQ